VQGWELMQIERDETSIWMLVRDKKKPLADLQNVLMRWSRQLSPAGQGCPTFLWEEDDCLCILTGAFLATAAHPELATQPATPSAQALYRTGLLRDYQAHAVDTALSAPWGRSSLDIAMGGGKTRIAAGLAAAGGGSWLYLVQNKELAAQAETEILTLLPRMTRELGTTARLVATTYAGVKRLPSTQFAGVIVDEAHGLAAPTRCVPYARVRAFWRVGMSGTLLDRQDAGNALVIGLLGPVVCKVGVEMLESKGHLAPGTVKVVRFRAN
jgi:superfamily II DNA or RNA helicase